MNLDVVRADVRKFHDGRPRVSAIARDIGTVDVGCNVDYICAAWIDGNIKDALRQRAGDPIPRVTVIPRSIQITAAQAMMERRGIDGPVMNKRTHDEQGSVSGEVSDPVPRATGVQRSPNRRRGAIAEEEDVRMERVDGQGSRRDGSLFKKSP